MERIDFFPFLGSDTIQQERSRMNDQLKSDLKSFLTYQKNAKQNRKNCLSVNSYTQDKISNFYAEENVPEAFKKSQNKVVKHLYDSSYVKPQENFRVI